MLTCPAGLIVLILVLSLLPHLYFVCAICEGSGESVHLRMQADSPDPSLLDNAIRTKIPHRRHCDVSLSKNINPSLVLVQPRKTRPFIADRLLMGR